MKRSNLALCLGLLSTLLSCLPQGPAAPTELTAILATEDDIQLQWPDSPGATSYNLYWDTSPGITTASNRITDVSSGFLHSDLPKGETYYYRVSALDSNGEGTLSVEASLVLPEFKIEYIPLTEVERPIFALAPVLTAGSEPSVVVVGARVEDGKYVLDTVHVLHLNGAGVWQKIQKLDFPSSQSLGQHAAIGDVRGLGVQDLFLTLDSTLHRFPADGQGGYLAPEPIPLESSLLRAGSVRAGQEGLLVVDPSADLLHLVHWDSQGQIVEDTVLAELDLYIDRWSSGLDIEDLDGDGDADILLSQPARALVQDSLGDFAEISLHLNEVGQGDVEAGDLDGDGTPEIVLAEMGGLIQPLIEFHQGSPSTGYTEAFKWVDPRFYDFYYQAIRIAPLTRSGHNDAIVLGSDTNSVFLFAGGLSPSQPILEVHLDGPYLSLGPNLECFPRSNDRVDLLLINNGRVAILSSTP